MSKEMRPQNACEFHSPRPPSGPSWLHAMAGKGQPEFMWILLRQPVASNSPLCRSLQQRYVILLRQFVYENGVGAMLVKGHPSELASIVRLQAAGSFYPSLVERVWIGALPIPEAIIANKPLGDERHIQIIGLDPDPSPKDELLFEVSHDARVNLAMVIRNPVALGVFFLMAGRGRPEAVAAIEEMHASKALPSPSRAGVILSVVSDEVGNPPGSGHYRDWLVLDFLDSRADQLRRFYGKVVGVLPADHAIYGHNLPPEPNSNVNAQVRIGMPRRPQEVRNRMEEYARIMGSKLNMKAHVSWVIDGVLVARPDLR